MKLKVATFAALALCTLVHGQTSTTGATTTKDGISLEELARDLKALPAAESSRELSINPSGLGSAVLPSPTLQSESTTPAGKRDPNTPPSASWLQDALNQTEAEHAQRHLQADVTFDRNQNPGDKSLSKADPLAQYLNQWLSPRDMELMRRLSDSQSAPDVKNGGQPDKSAAQPGWPSGALGDPVNQPGTMVVPILPLTHNPYLTEPEVAPAAPLPGQLTTQVVSGQPQTDHSRVATTQPAPAAVASTQNTATVKQPVTTPAESSAAPPTAPVVDDKKYFPQLRRF